MRSIVVCSWLPFIIALVYFSFFGSWLFSDRECFVQRGESDTLYRDRRCTLYPTICSQFHSNYSFQLCQSALEKVRVVFSTNLFWYKRLNGHGLISENSAITRLSLSTSTQSFRVSRHSIPNQSSTLRSHCSEIPMPRVKLCFTSSLGLLCRHMLAAASVGQEFNVALHEVHYVRKIQVS